MTNSTYAKIKKIISCALIQIFVFTSLLASQETIYQGYKANIYYQLRVPVGIDRQRSSSLNLASNLFFAYREKRISVTNEKLLGFLNGSNAELSGFNEHGKRKIGEEVEKWRDFLLIQNADSLPATLNKETLQDPVKFAAWLADNLKGDEYEFNYRLYFALTSYAGFMRSKVSTKDYWTEKSEQDGYYTLGDYISRAAFTLVPNPDEDKEKKDHTRLAGIFTQSLALAIGNAGQRLKIAATGIKEDSSFKIEMHREVPFRCDIFRHLIGYIDQIKEDGDISIVSLQETLIRYLKYINELNNNQALAEIINGLQPQALPVSENKYEKPKLSLSIIKQVHLDAETSLSEGKFKWLANNINRYKSYDAILLVGGLQAMPHYIVSPYEAAGFYFDPKYGNDSEFESLVKKAREQGIEIIIDVVLGHTGKDMAGFPFPEECYKHDENSRPFRGTWAYTLDYTSPKTEEIAFRYLYRLKRLGVKWIRCDQMGSLGDGSREFWSKVTEKLGIGMISETETVEAVEKPASATYFKLKLRNEEVEHWKGVSSFERLRSIVDERLKSYPDVPIILILDDHDENEKKPFSLIMQNNDQGGMNLNKLKAYYLSFYMLAMLYPGKVSIMEYTGTSEGHIFPLSFMYNFQGPVDFVRGGKGAFKGFDRFSAKVRMMTREVLLSQGSIIQTDIQDFRRSFDIYTTDKKYSVSIDLESGKWRADIKETDNITVSASVSVEGKQCIKDRLPRFGDQLIEAFDFLSRRGALNQIKNINIRMGWYEDASFIEGDKLVIKLRDVPFLDRDAQKERFLYFVYTIGRAARYLGQNVIDTSHASEPQVLEQEGNGVRKVVFKDPISKDIFMLIFNLNDTASGNKQWDEIFMPTAMTGDNKRYIVTSYIHRPDASLETRVRKFSLGERRMYRVGIAPGKECEILRFSLPVRDTKDADVIRFSAKDIQQIWSIPNSIKEVLSFFMSSQVFDKKIGDEPIFRINFFYSKAENLNVYVDAANGSSELVINMPIGKEINLEDIIIAVSKAMGIKDILLIAEVLAARRGIVLSKSLQQAIEASQKIIDKEREPRLSAIKEVLKRKRYIYENMTKQRPIDAEYAKWLERFVPNLKEYVIISWQMEMGFHPELELALMDVLQEKVNKGEMTLEEADGLFKKVLMANMAGGLGALVPDFRALADNGADVIFLALLQGNYKEEDGTLTPTAKVHIEALERLANKQGIKGKLGIQTISGLRVTFINPETGQEETREVDVHFCYLGKAIEVWITGSDVLYKEGEGRQNSKERASQAKFYNAAGQAVVKKLREMGVIEKDKEILNYEQEAYTNLPGKEGEDNTFTTNHTVVGAGLPDYPESYFSEYANDPLFQLSCANGRFYPIVYRILRSKRMTGVSFIHTEVLRGLLREQLTKVGLPEERIKQELKKIVYDEKYSSSNGTHPKHYQAPEIQDLIQDYLDQYVTLPRGEETLYSVAMNDTGFIKFLKDNREEFSKNLDNILLKLQKPFLNLLKAQGIELESEGGIYIGGIIRRIVDYKELIRFIDILTNNDQRRRFVESGIIVTVGGRFGPDKLNWVRSLITEHPELKNHVIVLDDYNIGDAPIIWQAIFNTMLSDKGLEAASTGGTKAGSNAHPQVAVRDGVFHEDDGYLIPFIYDSDHPENDTTNTGTGFFVEYDSEGRPDSESLLKCYESIGAVLKNPYLRKKIQFNALIRWLEKGNEITHQARGLLHIFSEAIEESRVKKAGEISQGVNLERLKEALNTAL